MSFIKKHITKVRNRQRVKPTAVQPVVMWTPTTWGALLYNKNGEL